MKFGQNCDVCTVSNVKGYLWVQGDYLRVQGRLSVGLGRLSVGFGWLSGWVGQMGR